MLQNKEKEGLCGQLIVDFVNAKSFDETCLRLFVDIQKIYNFSPNFVRKALEVIPPLESPTLPLNRNERVLFEQLVVKKKKGRRHPSEKAKEKHKIRYDKSLEKGAKKLLETKTLVSQERLSEIERLSSNYAKVIGPLKSFDQYRLRLKKVLDGILKGNNLYEDSFFVEFFRKHENIRPRIFLGKDGEIVEKPLFQENSFLDIRPFSKPKPYLKVIDFCTVEFLMPARNTKLIHLCEECRDFFISKTVRAVQPHRFCSDRCRLKLHNRERIKSGKNREFKARKRAEGAKPSYYG